jgi:hypothetical protein
VQVVVGERPPAPVRVGEGERNRAELEVDPRVAVPAVRTEAVGPEVLAAGLEKGLGIWRGFMHGGASIESGQ